MNAHIQQLLTLNDRGWSRQLFVDCNQALFCHECQSVCRDAIEISCHSRNEHVVQLWCDSCIRLFVQQRRPSPFNTMPTTVSSLKPCPICDNESCVGFEQKKNGYFRRIVLESIVLCPFSLKYQQQQNKSNTNANTNTSTKSNTDSIHSKTNAKQSQSQSQSHHETKNDYHCNFRGTLNDLLSKHIQQCVQEYENVSIATAMHTTINTQTHTADTDTKHNGDDNADWNLNQPNTNSGANTDRSVIMDMQSDMVLHMNALHTLTAGMQQVLLRRENEQSQLKNRIREIETHERHKQEMTEIKNTASMMQRTAGLLNEQMVVQSEDIRELTLSAFSLNLKMDALLSKMDSLSSSSKNSNHNNMSAHKHTQLQMQMQMQTITTKPETQAQAQAQAHAQAQQPRADNDNDNDDAIAIPTSTNVLALVDAHDEHADAGELINNTDGSDAEWIAQNLPPLREGSSVAADTTASPPPPPPPPAPAPTDNDNDNDNHTNAAHDKDRDSDRENIATSNAIAYVRGAESKQQEDLQAMQMELHATMEQHLNALGLGLLTVAQFRGCFQSKSAFVAKQQPFKFHPQNLLIPHASASGDGALGGLYWSGLNHTFRRSSSSIGNRVGNKAESDPDCDCDWIVFEMQSAFKLFDYRPIQLKVRNADGFLAQGVKSLRVLMGNAHSNYWMRLHRSQILNVEKHANEQWCALNYLDGTMSSKQNWREYVSQHKCLHICVQFVENHGCTDKHYCKFVVNELDIKFKCL